MLPGDGVDGVLTELPSLTVGCGFPWEGPAVVLPELISLRVGCAHGGRYGGVLPELTFTNMGCAQGEGVVVYFLNSPHSE